jgi:hypothetical protein
MNETSIKEVPFCIHDGLRQYTETKDGDRLHLEVRCDCCGTSLYSRVHDLVTNTIIRHIHNDIYELLYMRKGRLKLVIEALKNRGWPVPNIWEEDE